MYKVRLPSLFWTFSVALLAVLVLAAVLQSWVTVTLLTRLRVEFAGESAAHLTEQAGKQIAALQDPVNSGDIISVLRRYLSKDPAYILLFHSSDGTLLPDRRLPGPQMRRIGALLGLPEGAVPEPGAAGDFRRPGPRLRPPSGAGDAETGRPDQLPEPLPDEEITASRYYLLDRQEVSRDGQRLGEVIAVFRGDRQAPWSQDDALPLLLFIPLALLLAGGGGMILLRLLLRRIRQLECFADKVSEGDLVARIADPGNDEIGRLGQRLNHMAEVLQEAKTTVEASERQRRQLLAEVSHELGTPLTSIRGYTETLLDPKVPKSVEETALYLENVLEESERMAGLLDDLYDLAHLEADPAVLTQELLDFAALCENTVNRFVPHFQRADINLAWQRCQGPVKIFADGRRMEQVVENLLNNAIRYVPTGGAVTFALESDGSRCRLQIDDTGPGVPEQDLPRLFHRFFQAGGAANKKGSGLGLAIVHTIVSRHGGTVAAQNLRPSGLRIVIELPVAQH